MSLLAQKVGYVYQDFENQIVRPTVLDDASYACLNYAFPDYLERGRAALEQCGLKENRGDFIWQRPVAKPICWHSGGAVPAAGQSSSWMSRLLSWTPSTRPNLWVLRELNENYGKTIIVIEHHGSTSPTTAAT